MLGAKAYITEQEDGRYVVDVDGEYVITYADDVRSTRECFLRIWDHWSVDMPKLEIEFRRYRP